MRAARAAKIRGGIGDKVYSTLRSKGEQNFTEVFQSVLLNNTGINITSLPYNKESMEHELELSQRLHGAADSALDKSQGTVDEGNTPGTFVVLEAGVSVSSEPSPGASELGALPGGALVKVLEVRKCREDKVLRGRIEQPDGWIPIVSQDGRCRWARKEAGPDWSEDAEELSALLKQLGPRNANLSSEAFLKPFFRHLQLPERGLCALDEDVAKFSRLTFLDVSRNPLTAVEHLPPSLKFLKAYNTRVACLACEPLPSLSFLGLGYCPLQEEALQQAAASFGNLLSLDLSYTEVSRLDEVTSHLAAFPRLRHLCLTGSPVSLLPFYRLRTIHALPRLAVLDGVEVTQEESSDAQLIEGLSAPLPSSLRLALQPLSLQTARAILAPAAEVILSARRELFAQAAAAADAAATAAAAAGSEAEEAERLSKARAIRAAAEKWGKEGNDSVLEACKNGLLRLRLQLPDGSWLETSELKLSQEGAEEAFDALDLSQLRRADGTPLDLELELQGPKLLEACRWMRRGLAVRAFLRPAAPPNPEEAEEEVVAAPGKGGKAGKGAAAKGKAAPAKAKGAPVVEEEVEAVPQEEFAVAGGVLPLDVFFWRQGTGVSQAMREAKELGKSPEPLAYEPQPVLCLAPEERWLDPEVQVPLAPRKQTPPMAQMPLKVVFFAPDQPEEPPAPEPAAARSNSKAKGKK